MRNESVKYKLQPKGNLKISHYEVGIFKKVLIFSSAISLVISQEAIASKRLSGAGATFPSKIYTRWFLI